MEAPSQRIAYVVSRFPKLTETFVLYEILALRDMGIEVDVFPLVKTAGNEPAHPECAALEPSVGRYPLLSVDVISALARTACTRPLRFLGALTAAVRGAGWSRAHLVRAAATFPKSVRIAAEMERRGVTHIHAHFANHPALCARVTHALTGIPYSFTAHGSDLHRDPSGLREKVRASRFTVAVSDYNREFILEHAGSDLASKVVVLHCGADLARFGASDGQAARHANGQDAPLRIACVAALRQVKGHTYLLRALRLLRDRGVAFECRLAGDGPLADELRREIHGLDLEAHVQMLGPCERPRIAELLDWANVITLNSIIDRDGRREGIPVSLMEGMAAGLPVVASRLSGIPELVIDGDTGALCPPGNPSSIADAFERIARSPDSAAQMGARGRDRVRANFDLTENARALARSIVELDDRKVDLPQARGA